MSDTPSQDLDQQPEGGDNPTEGTTAIEAAEAAAAAEAELEGDGEGEAPGGKPAPAPENPELLELRQRLADLEPLAQLGQRVLAQQAPAPAAPQGSSRDPRVDHAIRMLYDSSLTDEARRDAFKAFPIEVRQEALRRDREAQEEHVLRMTDPDAWAERVIAPVVQRMVAPVAAKFAKREFLVQNPDLASPADMEEVAQILGDRVPLHYAAELARLRKAERTRASGAPPADPDTRARQADAEALKNARRGRAAPARTTARDTKPPAYRGWKAEDVLFSLEEAGQLDSEE